MMTKDSVSLCMIVKDEEDSVLAAIESVRDLIDELIVVDTGSKDKTPLVALEAGAKIFTFNWTMNFSAARNFALQQASSTWVLVLDADEVLEPINSETFITLLSDKQVEGYYFRIKSVLDSMANESCDQVVRLFRNRQDYQFEGAIHEQIAPSILKANNGCGLASVPFTILHYGYQKDRLEIKEKFNRNSQIIIQELQLTPNNPFLLYCLGLEYYQQNSILKGLNYLTDSLTLLTGNEGYFEDVLLNVALGYLRLEKTSELIDFTNKVLNMFPNQADFLYLRGLAYLQNKNFLQAATDFEQSLTLETNTLATLYQVNCLLGDAHQSSGQFPLAQDAYNRALEFAPSSSYPLQQLISLIRKGYPVTSLLNRSLLFKNWPNIKSWHIRLNSLINISTEPHLLMLFLTLHRTINTVSFSPDELSPFIKFLLKITAPQKSYSSLDTIQNISSLALRLVLNEILINCIALIKDMEHDNFKLKTTVNETIKQAISILCF